MLVARSRFAQFLLAALVGLALPAASRAADFASQVTRIVVPFAPGGGTDIIARTLAQEMAKQLGGTVIVENRPGAGAIIGTEYVAKAEPDGHTVVMATFAHAVNDHVLATGVASCFIGFDGIQDPLRVPGAVIAALPLGEHSAREPLEFLLDAGLALAAQRAATDGAR